MFLLNYIPYIGPLIAVVTLLIVASIQVTQLVPFIFLGILLTAIQIILGNFVEPKWLGVRLNLSRWLFYYLSRFGAPFGDSSVYF